MALVHDPSKNTSLAARLLTTDFCPWANRFVYWLKEPVGWLVLANLVSVLVGLYIAPVGWTMAASLTAVIAVGMIWPAIAVRIVTCRLFPATPQIHEGDACQLQLNVQNRFPIPLWGLAIEGFLDRKCDSDNETNIPTVALAFVRPSAISTYSFAVSPQLRGHYPNGTASLTCSFPFGIWTAKKDLEDVAPVTVWPKVFPMRGQTGMTGRRDAEAGEGNRTGRTGDFLGLREYRHGDSIRQVNWVASARADELIVTQRSGPQCAFVQVIVDATSTSDRDQLADRVRVAASVLANLHRAGFPLRLLISNRSVSIRTGWDGFVQMMDVLAEIPEYGVGRCEIPIGSRQHASITVASSGPNEITVCATDPSANLRQSTGHLHRTIRRDQDIAEQMLSFWTEVRDENLVA